MSVVGMVSAGTPSHEAPGRAPLRRRPFLRNGAALVVASIAAYVSYWHMVDLCLAHGQRTDMAHLMPFSVDGMMIVAAGFIGVRRFAYVAFTAGIGASIAANALAAPPDVLSRVISAWPAVALLIVVELLRRQHPDFGAPQPSTTPEMDELVWDQLPEAPVSPAPRPASPAEWVAEADALHDRNPGWTKARVAEALGVSAEWIRKCRREVPV